MPRSALRCVVDINLHAVTCPGVWLPRRDDVYLTVTLFNQVRRTSMTAPIFPLPFHERFRFDKVFYTCYEPTQVADTLEGMKVLIELIQFSDLYAGGRLLAYYEGSARDFLYPFPSYSTTYGTTDRELLLERSLDFPGISPKLEFSTKTSIQETSAPILGGPTNGLASRYRSPSPRRSRSRSRANRSQSRSRSRSMTRSSTYSRPTVSSAYRSRSVSPISSLKRRMDSLDLAISNDDDSLRPPFVVRKVDKELIGRRPGSPSPMRTSTLSSGKKKSSRYTASSGSHLDDYVYNYRPRYLYDTYYNYTPRYTSTYSDHDSDDADLDLLTSKSPRYLSSRPRSTSPYRIIDSIYDEDYALRSEIIRRRIDNVLRRNRSLDRLDLYTPATYYDWRRYPYYY